MEIFLDNASTTKISEKALKTFIEISEKYYGNSSSIHRDGQKTKAILENSRDRVSEILDCKASEVIFTSSASEANSMVMSYSNKIAISSIEHRSIMDFTNIRDNIYKIPVNKEGLIKEDYDILNSFDRLSIMHSNNETGVIQPMNRLRENFKGLIHSDITQSIGKIKIDFKDMDSYTLSAHKFHGPKGVGILITKGTFEVKKLIFGGDQERNKRSGTENVAAIASAVVALEEAVKDIDRFKEVRILRDYFEKSLKKNLRVKVNSENAERLPNISSITFEDISSDILLFNLDYLNIFASAGSACSSGSMDSSYVLKAMDIKKEDLFKTVRFSFNKYTSRDEINFVVKSIINIIKNGEKNV
jgi:cysteine desulfurase